MGLFVRLEKKKKKKGAMQWFSGRTLQGIRAELDALHGRWAVVKKKANKGVFLCVGGSFFLFHFPAKRITPARGRRGRFSSGRRPPP